MGGLGAPSQCVVQGVAVGSIGGAASIGEAVLCESGVDVDRPSVDGSGGGGMDEQDAGVSLAFGISYGTGKEPAGEGKGLRGTDGGGVDVAVQDRLSLVIRHDSDDEESDDEGGIGMDAASYGLGQVQHRSMDWEGLCAYERMVFAGAAAVGSGADVVDRGIAAHGDVSVDGGEIGLFAEDKSNDMSPAARRRMDVPGGGRSPRMIGTHVLDVAIGHPGPRALTLW